MDKTIIKFGVLLLITSVVLVIFNRCVRDYEEEVLPKVEYTPSASMTTSASVKEYHFINYFNLFKGGAYALNTKDGKVNVVINPKDDILIAGVNINNGVKWFNYSVTSLIDCKKNCNIVIDTQEVNDTLFSGKIKISNLADQENNSLDVLIKFKNFKK